MTLLKFLGGINPFIPPLVYAPAYSTVFSLFWNCLRVVDDAHRVGGRSFQVESPETAKLCCPYVDVLAQGIIRSPRGAKRRKRRPVWQRQEYTFLPAAPCTDL